MLEVVDINVSYGSIQALWDVSFLVRKGEIVTLLGSTAFLSLTATDRLMVAYSASLTTFSLH